MFWFFRYRIPYSPSTADPSDRLLRTLAQDKWKRISHDVTPTHVKLEHKLPIFMRNSWNPIFDGSFVADGRQRFLIGYFRVNWFVFAFIVFFMLFAGYQAVSTFLEPSVRSGYIANWREQQLWWDLSFFGMALGINVIGWLFGLPYQQRIMAAIRESADT